MEPTSGSNNAPVSEEVAKETEVTESIVSPVEPSSQASTSSGASQAMKQNDALNESTLGDDDDDDAEEDEETVTMLDVLKEQEELCGDTLAVLGSADDANCSFLKGYVSRQPLYACTTCEMKTDPETGSKYLAGFCLACSYHCHEGHEIVELYTKRQFRCDCGNEKFATTICKLYEKTGFNEKNKYNHNFSGVYCTCNRPYPDPADPIPDCMIQCGLCEDWFHGRHLSSEKNKPDHTEMVCSLCVKKNSFLVYYAEDGRFEENEDTSVNDSFNQTVGDDKILAENETESLDSGIVTETSSGEPIASSSSQLSNDASASNNSIISCKLTQSKESYIAKYQTEDIDEAKFVSYFLGRDWRLALCKCESCEEMYRQKGLEFITSQSDMIYFYEQDAIKESKNSSEDKAMSEFNKFGRVQQIELISGFNDLKAQFDEYFEPFKAQKRVVKKEDIDEFFAQMHARKRQRVDMPYYCN